MDTYQHLKPPGFIDLKNAARIDEWKRKQVVEQCIVIERFSVEIDEPYFDSPTYLRRRREVEPEQCAFLIPQAGA